MPIIIKKRNSTPWNKGLKGWNKKYKNAGFQKGHPQYGNGMLGKHHSELTKKKIGEASLRLGLRPPIMIGEDNPRWKGGKYQTNNRWFVKFNKHPFADKRGYILQYRFIAEKLLGRYLKLTEVIHHINFNSLDDRPENLYLFPSKSKHTSYHGLKNKPILISNLL